MAPGLRAILRLGCGQPQGWHIEIRKRNLSAVCLRESHF